MNLTQPQIEEIRKLLDSRIGWLRRQIRAQESLSEPCPPGRWRWADVKPGGYGRKSEQELARDRAAAAKSVTVHRAELEVAIGAREALR